MLIIVCFGTGVVNLTLPIFVCWVCSLGHAFVCSLMSVCTLLSVTICSV